MKNCAGRAVKRLLALIWKENGGKGNRFQNLFFLYVILTASTRERNESMTGTGSVPQQLSERSQTWAKIKGMKDGCNQRQKT